MVTKQSSKPLKHPTTKCKELSSIGNKLLNHCEKCQSVFLYDKDNIGRKELIKDVHIANGGIDAETEIINDKKMPPLANDAKELLGLLGILEKKDDKDFYRYEGSTKNTWNYIDCGIMSAKEVYIKLVLCSPDLIFDKKFFEMYKKADVGRMSKVELIELQKNSIDSLIYLNEYVYSGYLFNYEGLLFADNLSCDPRNSEDNYYYSKLGEIIKYREIELTPTTFNWLVAYTHDLNDFRKVPYFIERFEQIPLPKIKEPKAEGKKVNFDDVKLEISVDNTDAPLFDAIVSANGVDREKLPLEPGYLEPLHLLAYNKKHNISDGWVFNKDLDRTCNKESIKAKYEIKKAFKKIIGKRAEGIISVRYSSAKKLNIPKKNIKFSPIS